MTKVSLRENERKNATRPRPTYLRNWRTYILSSRRYDQSIADFQKTPDLEPNAAWIHAELAWAYAMKGMYAQALAEYGKIPEQDKTVANENQLVASGFGWLHAVSGRRADALRVANYRKRKIGL